MNLKQTTVYGAVLISLITAAMTRFSRGNISYGAFQDRIKEYSLLMTAGLFFGFMLAVALKLAFEKPGDWRVKALAYSGIAAAPLFLAVIHQTRNFLNDGPATVAMAVGFLAALAITSLTSKSGER